MLLPSVLSTVKCSSRHRIHNTFTVLPRPGCCVLKHKRTHQPAGTTHSQPQQQQQHRSIQQHRVSVQATAVAAAMGEVGHESLPGLLGTCVLMFLGAYGCGMLPSWLPIREERLASINALGAGLLLGSALVIILPEGFEAAQNAIEESALPEWCISLALLAGFWCMLLLDTLSHLLPPSSSSSSSSTALPRSLSDPDPAGFEACAAADDAASGDAAEEHVILLSDIQHKPTSNSFGSQPPTPRASPRPATPLTSSPAAAAAEGRPGHKAGDSGNLRLLAAAQQQQQQQGWPVEEAAAASGAASRPAADGGGSSSSRMAWPRSGTAARQGQQPAGQAAAAADTGGAGQGLSSWLREPSQQALLGLMVHAASDGLAVGAASLASEPAVGLSVAAAMVVHKGPVAVGLSAYLRSARWKPASVHKGILLFSAASPAAALLTYFLLSALPFLSHGGNIPLAVLFSGGTVLYAATMHILPSALGGGSHSHAHSGHHYSALPSSSGAVGKGGVRRSGSRVQPLQEQRKSQLLLVSAGMLLPLVLSAVFHHEHGH